MRYLLALFVLFSLAASAQDSADMASTAGPTKAWQSTRDLITNTQPNRAKVKDFVRDLLGEERGKQATPPEENSAAPVTAE